MSSYVVDASALLAVVHGEPGAGTVQAALDGSAMSTVNWCEVQERSVTRGVDVTELRAEVLALGLELVSFTVDDAEHAAGLRASTRAFGLSLGDRACLALAARLDRPALTADRAWLDLDLGVQVETIR